MDILIKTIQVLLALSILILVHELGHFCFAKMFRIRVEKFYLFFDWGFALFKWKPKKSETEYGIGWLPLGGYCKIAGMVDMAGGVIFNFLLAIVIYIILLLGWGKSYIKNSDAAVYTSPLAYEMGFRNGDKIIGFDDYTPEDFSALSADLLHEQAETATVLRGGDTVKIDLGDDYIPKILQQKQPIFGIAVPFVVDEVIEGSLNEGVFLPGDSLVAVNAFRT